ncbi:MAG: Nramp family divalent metal transporter, partial [Planctomycetota bacterium]
MLSQMALTSLGQECREDPFQTPPAALASLNPLRWLTVFGPGAIVASLTIGTGELIFSSRGGALFGYRILSLFAVISLFKWTLLYSAARHMVLTGVHPLRRWLDAPLGPRGWLPAVMVVFAAVCIPVWVSFHASVLGDWVASLTGTKRLMNGATVHLWGMLTLLGVALLALRGGYSALEKVQLAVVSLMLLTVSVALALLKPDWLEMLWGAVWPRPLAYPDWLTSDARPELQRIAARPVWVEGALYVGVIGGASFDYLAYTSFLRDKRWGLAGKQYVLSTLTPLTDSQQALLKRWIRAPLIDCTLSFLVVLGFSAVFVASGRLVLAPQRLVPGDGGFLQHQAQFVTQLHPWLYPLYVVGTLLAMLGTLYGTLEVAPAVFREASRLLARSDAAKQARSLRRVALAWTVAGAVLVLVVSFAVQYASGASKPAGLTTLL